MNFTKSMAKQLGPKGIRVNGVAPGPIWTPLQVSGGATMEKLEKFGGDTPLGRPGQPAELASIYVQLAAADASYANGHIRRGGRRWTALRQRATNGVSDMTDRNSEVSENADFGSKNPTSTTSVDLERTPMPDRTPETNSDDPEMPPARSGGVPEPHEEPTEGDPVDNPVHHTGHMPPPVTANRD